MLKDTRLTSAANDDISKVQHIAIIMDGNGRWAKERLLPRFLGHKKGLKALENTVIACAKRKVRYLTVFAFSTENWRRPSEEVSFLMNLFLQSLQKQVVKLHENNLRLRIIGSRERLSSDIVRGIEKAEQLTAKNQGLVLNVAVDYGGRWDIVQAANRALSHGVNEFSEEVLRRYLSLGDLPEPDLFIRTGGEQRVSNFMLWQLAYTEFYFTETLWPEFRSEELDRAIASFEVRERRFGRTSEQLFLEKQR